MRRFSFFGALLLASVGVGALGAGCATAIIAPGTGGGGTTTGGGEGGTGGGQGGSDAGHDVTEGPCTGASDCTSFNDTCNTGTCINGACSKVPANELGSCDDGLNCTENDTCQGGTCVGGTTKFCPATTSCSVGSCDLATDTCIEVAGNDGAPCNDEDACTLPGSCLGGACQAGGTVDCSFLDDTCSAGFCDPLVGCKVMPLNNGTGCDDNLYCTINDTCTDGQCTGVPNTCAAPGDICLIGSCNEATDSCVAVPGNNGASCDDQSACTMGETCSNGTCGGGAPANQGGACNDNNACTSGDACQNGACQGAPIVACASNDGCCPPGCTNATDNDCTCNVNLAIGATPSISSGGNSAPYSPAEMNNGIGQNTCQWAWIDSNVAPTGAWAQLAWAQPVTIGSFYIETENGLNPGPPCNNPAGRNIKSATVQYWSNNQWVTATSFSNQHDDVQIDLNPPVTTTKLRIFDITTDPGNGNAMIYEWHVYQGPGCIPPP